MRGFEGRDQLRRFRPGDEWKKMPDRCKAPNRGMRLKPRQSVRIECWCCGKEVQRFRKSARYCGDECRRRAQLERDARRKGKPYPAERIRGAERRQLAMLKGIRRYGNYPEYVRFTIEQKRKREADRDEKQWQKIISQESTTIGNPSTKVPSSLTWGALERRAPPGVIRYVRVFRP